MGNSAVQRIQLAAGENPVKKFAIPFFLICLPLYAICAWLPDAFFEPVNRYTAATTAFLLQGLGGHPVLNGVFISLDGFNARIITECSAVFILILFCSFVLAYPASARHKGIGLLFGIPALIAANFFRLVFIYQTGSRFPALFEIVHLYMGQLFMIVLVFAACLLWLRHIAMPGGKNTPLSFIVRFIAITAIPFGVWFYLHKGYVLLDAVIVEWVFALAGYDLHLSPDMERIYPNTFNLIAFIGLILATKEMERPARIKNLFVGLGILSLAQILVRIVQTLTALSGLSAAVKLTSGLLILNTYLLPFVLWLAMTRKDLFDILQIPVCPYCGARKIGMAQHILAKHKGQPLPSPVPPNHHPMGIKT